MLRVGLTGGIACGKSHVLRRLAERGCRTLDLDAVARAVTAPGSEALAEIRAAFGDAVVDATGALDRPALGALVFRDASARERLNRIVHPRVRAAEAGWASSAARAAGAVLVTDGALLIEAGLHLRFDRLVVVHCAPALQLQRLRERDGLDEDAARARIAAQLPSTAKLAFAHYDVDTSGTPGDTDLASERLAEQLGALAREPGAPARADGLDRFADGLARGADEGPRGLSPSLLLEAAAAAGGLEMDALARALRPPASGAWYRAADAAPAGRPAARLAIAVAAWAYARRGGDPDFAAAAAGTVARLTHSDPEARTDACLVALVALSRAGAAAAGPARPEPRAFALAERFGGGRPSGGLDAVWAALERAPLDPPRAAELSSGLGGDGPIAAALAGLLVRGACLAAAPWRRALEAIRAGS